VSYYLTDGAHCLISGATGAGDDYGGKSVLANWWFQQSVERGWHDVGVFFDPKGLGYVSRSDDVRRVRTLKGLAQSYRAGYRLFDYYARATEKDALEEEHDRLIQMLRQMGGSKIVAHDEAQSYKGSPGLNWCLSQGGNMANSSEPTDDIRSLTVTQRPWNLGETLRANMPLKIWVGPFGNEAENFFDSEQMTDAKQKVRAATAPYHWSVTDGGDYVTTHEPVPVRFA